MAFKTGVRVTPSADRLYSTWGGTTGFTSRTISLSDSNSRKCWISIFSVILKASGVKKVVNLSSVGADQADGIGPVSGLHLAEEALKSLNGVDIRHLRAGFFYTNFYSAIGMIRQAGIYGNNCGADAPVAMVHPRDIAAAAAEALLSLGFKGSSVRYVVSDERTSREITAVLGASIG